VTGPTGPASGDANWRYEAASDGGSVSGLADVFPANSAITTEASTLYEFEALIFYRRGSPGGTTVFTFTNTQTYTRLNAALVGSPAAGMSPVATSMNIGAIEGVTTAAAAMPATPSQTANTDHFALLKGNFLTNVAGTWRIRWTPSAGSVTLQAGSYFTAKKISSGSIGTFVA
jgi:hypothetical protein